MLQVFINGPPGAGKSSLAERLCENYNLAHIATGTLLRDNIVKNTKVGSEASNCIRRKELIPDAVVIDMVADAVSQCAKIGKEGWILDGFPRTAEQCTAMRNKQIVPSLVIILELEESECIKRITGRMFDTVTKRIYHEKYHIPSSLDVSKRLCRRKDDALERILPRMEAYRVHGASISEKCALEAFRMDAKEDLETVFRSACHLIKQSQCNTENSDNQMEELQRSNSKSKRTQNPTEHHSTDNPLHLISSESNSFVSSNNINTQRLENECVSLKSEANQAVTSLVEAVQRVQTAKKESADREIQWIAPFKVMLEDGFNVKKHGRRGRPHIRTVYTDLDHSRVFWQNSSEKRTENGSYLKRPTIDQSLALCEVLRVVRGQETNVLKRSGKKELSHLYVSLITEKRSLDLEFETEEMAIFVANGFRTLLAL
uniref:Adenylate kinase putative n=1 Tax=Albugo laibachii Nc14 TaxID=890382 RepID=F0WY73_9STRA|nr:adenylate kinase putative [Albugo laibachii Nc14]|eukprot:CCA26425.1 adenylate kinase putative [Albugo laibachii Nc14]